MVCIFCKQNSENAIGVEHIIPESLGNKEHILPKGVECDRCNNYFATKIERPMLELPYFISARNRMAVENKKRRVPVDWGMLLSPRGSKIHLRHENYKNPSIDLLDEQTYQWLIQQKTFSMIVPANSMPPDDNSQISKFLGKVAPVTLAKIGLEIEEGLTEVTYNSGLPPLRDYVRYGKGTKFWPHHMRQLYIEDKYFSAENISNTFQVLHEYQLFQTTQNAWHLVLVIFGIEFCLNLGEPTTADYRMWLEMNNQDSPLYGHFNNNGRADPAE
ncbi:hypothetical protein FHW88_005205 [Mucilaginibacter sp. SG538B]|uniref:HNH endonuclease n=1 Tax=Mucilaginibacter sp. SG538B TaxID=2587021 RepID=UPI00159E3D53|nr:HNH endonuclease [Mucilaginibacter sp. SG538B]NVM66887.1 hypothetical protein [Mucilaginibacter sp. SG538B]